MKILVSADWHLKLGQKSVPKEWAINRYKMLFKQLHSLEDSVSLHVIAGDIVDRLPNMEELALYFEFIKDCTIETIIIPGNHESDKRNTTFLTYLKEVTSSINPLVRIIDDYFSNDLYDIIPYNKLKEFNPKDFNNKILFTHCRAEIPPHVKAEIDLDLFNRWDVVLAGDLHSYENSQRNILYPGSPVTTSFHRSVVDTGVILFDTQTHSHEWIKLALPQLIRKTIKAGEEMLATDYHHTVYEIEGDMAELGAMADSQLIDKKIVKRETDTALILDPKMTMAEELKEYLTYILQLPEDSIESAVETFRSASSKFL
jgi:DNA repair exonuclease SbcCD nuclease subunit